MQIIHLKKLIIENFKGIKRIDIDFDKVTNISGDNALGKTSIFDSFTWLMFDKDSKNRSTFDIKPLDEYNNVIRELNPTVTAILEVNGKEIKLSKMLEEKWSKKRGESEKTFTGNVTTYEINDVPVKQSDYKKKVSEIAEEEQFKLLTNPYYFSQVLNWKEARKIILEVAGDITVSQVIDSNKELEPIRLELENADIDTILKSKKASMKKLADKKKEIPTRINECDRSITDVDFTLIKSEVEEYVARLDLVEEELLDVSKANEMTLKQKESIFEIKNKIQSIKQKALAAGNTKKFDLMDKLMILEKDLKTIEMNKERVCSDEQYKLSQVDRLAIEVNKLREEFNVKNSETIDLNSVENECPTCKRVFDLEDINHKKQQLIENFNTNKAKQLQEIREKGTNKNKEIEAIKNNLETLKNQKKAYEDKLINKQNEVNALKLELEEFKVEAVYSIIDKENIEKLNNELLDLENEVASSSTINTEDLKEKKKLINNKINELNKELAKEDLNKELLKRKEELLEEEKELGVEIAKQEKVVMLCEEFIKTRVNLLESNINNKFKNVSFKLFKEQVNGGIDETCEALVNGVPFSNVNTAGQINAGLDIINTLSKHFETQVPIFIDNKESVNELIEIDSQVINLVVTKDNPLKIETLQTEGVM